MTDFEFLNNGSPNQNNQNKADRITGYFVAPRTGVYKFFVSASN